MATDTTGDSQPTISSSPIPRPILVASFLIFLLIGLAIHHAGFTSPMLYDSKAFIHDKAQFFARHDPSEVLRIVPVRPLFMMTLYANYLFAGMEPYYFRLVNVTILAAAGVMLTLLILLLLELPDTLPHVRHTAKRWISLLLGLFFVIHPLQTYVVLYIWQREAIMACFFYFAAMAAYVAVRQGRFRCNLPWYIATGFLCFAGLLSKENLATLPCVLLMAELILFRQGPYQIMRRAAVIAAVTLPPAALYAFLTTKLYGNGSVHPPGIVHRLIQYYSDSGLTPIQVMLTECRVFFSYLFTVVAPSPQNLDLLKAQTISKSLIDPPSTLPAVVGVIGLIAVAAWLSRRKPLMAFGILFFIITLSPESFLIPQYLFFGYRPILPMAGLLLVVAQGLAEVSKVSRTNLLGKRFKIVATSGVLALFMSFAAVTWYEAETWNPSRFWERAFERLPPFSGKVELTPYVTVLTGYGRQLVDESRQVEGIEILAQAVRLGCGDEPTERGPSTHIKTGLCPSAANNLGEALLRSGDQEAAVKLFRKALKFQPGHAGAINNLGNVMLGLGRVSEAIALYRRGIAMNAESPELHNNLGAALLKDGDVRLAREEFHKAVTMNPRFAKARVNLAITSLKMQAIPEALTNLNAALEINPLLALAYVYRGQALERSGHVAQAAQDYAKAVEIKPNLLQAHYHLARTMAQMNQIPSAIAQYQRVLQLNPKDYQAYRDLGSLFLATSRWDEAAAHLRKALEIRPDSLEARALLESALQGVSHKPKGQ